MSESDELGECPFCGEGDLGGRMRVTDVDCYSERELAHAQYRVECDLCDFQGPRYVTHEAARDTWESAVGRKLASWDDLLAACELAQDSGVDAEVFAAVTAAIAKARG